MTSVFDSFGEIDYSPTNSDEPRMRLMGYLQLCAQHVHCA